MYLCRVIKTKTNLKPGGNGYQRQKVMKTSIIKAVNVEGNYEFNNNDGELFYHILNLFFNEKEKYFDKVAERIGIKQESEIDDPFNLFQSYENLSEIEDAANSEFNDAGYSRDLIDNGYIINTPNYEMAVEFGSDFGGSECVRQNVIITITSK